MPPWEARRAPWEPREVHQAPAAPGGGTTGCGEAFRRGITDRTRKGRSKTVKEESALPVRICPPAGRKLQGVAREHSGKNRSKIRGLEEDRKDREPETRWTGHETRAPVLVARDQDAGRRDLVAAVLSTSHSHTATWSSTRPEPRTLHCRVSMPLLR